MQRGLGCHFHLTFIAQTDAGCTSGHRCAGQQRAVLTCRTGSLMVPGEGAVRAGFPRSHLTESLRVRYAAGEEHSQRWV